MPYVTGESLRIGSPASDSFRWTRPCGSPTRPRARSTTPIDTASSTATSSPRTCCSPRTATRSSPTSASGGSWTRAGGSGSPSRAWCWARPRYMSPEQAAGDPQLDGRTDIYSLGVVLYEMLAGEPPFTGPSPQSIAARRLTEQPRPLRLARETVPPALEHLVMRALARSPADRFTAGELAEALDTARRTPAATETVVLPPPGAVALAADRGHRGCRPPGGRLAGPPPLRALAVARSVAGRGRAVPRPGSTAGALARRAGGPAGAEPGRRRAAPQRRADGGDPPLERPRRCAVRRLARTRDRRRAHALRLGDSVGPRFGESSRHPAGRGARAAGGRVGSGRRGRSDRPAHRLRSPCDCFGASGRRVR